MKILILILLTLNVPAQSWQNDFGKEDNNSVKHYWVSNVGTMILSNAYHKKVKSEGLSCLYGGLTMFSIGYAKEVIYDGIMNKGTKSKIDLFFDGWGCLTGMMQARVMFDIRKRNKEKEILKLEKLQYAY